MEIIGRLTADAIVSETKHGKEVTNFTLALNDFYKSSSSGEIIKVTAFIRCAYWLNAKVAAFMKKGGIVSVQGRIGIETYKDKQGEAAGNITCHVNKINIHSGSGKTTESDNQSDKEQISAKQANGKDDLPF